MAARRGKSTTTDYDIFDDVVLIEQKLHSDGYNEGYFNGQLVGELEGFSIGIERGKSFGQEIGFYEGFASTLSLLFENEPKSKKLLKVLSQMNASIESICCRCIDPQDQDLFDDLEKVRAKFKQVSSMVNATPDYGNSVSFDF